MDDEVRRPVITGLIALVGVGLAVGLILGGVVLVATRVLGVGDSTSGSSAGDQESLYLPKPSPTQARPGSLITLAPGASPPSAPTAAPTGPPTTSAAPARKGITLQSQETAVGSYEQIDLTGVYPSGEGAILQVQRLSDGTWQDFPVTTSVTGGIFSCPVQTGQTGLNRFRVVDTDTGRHSNTVSVQVR